MAKQRATEEGAEGRGGGSALLYYVEHNKTHTSCLPLPSSLLLPFPTAVSDNCVTAC